MFEPVGGSAPQYAGKNVLSPIAAILSAQMMFAHLAEKHNNADFAQAAATIETAVTNVFRDGKIPSLTVHSGVGTVEQTQYVLDEIRSLAA